MVVLREEPQGKSQSMFKADTLKNLLDPRLVGVAKVEPETWACVCGGPAVGCGSLKLFSD